MAPVMRLRLPRVNEPPLALALPLLGRALAESYRSYTEEPIPEHLACILRALEAREEGVPPARAPSGGGLPRATGLA